MHSDPVDYTLNPGMPTHTLAAGPSRVLVMRTLAVDLVYGVEAYGDVAMDALDPGTGDMLLSCMLLDSVSVGAVAVSADGIGYVSGTFMGDVLECCDGSQLPALGTGPFNVNHFLLAWDLVTGEILWSRNLTADHSELEEVSDLTFDQEGRPWMLLRAFDAGAAVRFGPDGTEVESRSISGIRTFGTMRFDPAGGLYVSGGCENGTLQFGGQDFPVESDGGYNMFVLRFRPDGAAGFAAFAEDVTFQKPTVVAGSDDRAYLAGNYFTQTQWGDLSLPDGTWGDQLFLTALDSTGMFHWALSSTAPGGAIMGDMTRSRGPCLALDVDDHIYLLGAVRGSVDWGNGVVSGGSSLLERRLTVTAFDTDGQAQWQVSSDPTTWGVEPQTLSASASAGVVHVVAHTADPFRFGGIQVGAEEAQAAVVARIHEVSTGIPPAPSAAALTVWPVPADEQLFVELEGAPMGAALLNSAGQRVRSVQLGAGRNRVDLQGLQAGLYLLRTVDGRQAKVMVQ